ncbi:hypothetical protein LSH36_859g02062 [Paralvinella palmiformis]|uniref:MIR domain-containing protein n=1 Tax=Paralvinella palmiformis TaxID=53620 RepID=A0AAD9MT76_9ANNE|nr:hypothetical protein LSH36_859g02062 [Paralvinella palmiformis]
MPFTTDEFWSASEFWQSKERHNFLSIGDLVCLYCEETQGYVYNCQTSTVHNGLQIYHKQNMEQPRGIPDPRGTAAVFCVCVPNRYKLAKKYRRLLESISNPDGEEERELLEHVKAASIAENTDNVLEQKRNTGRRVRYGEVIQLKHSFTGKYIHMSTTKTSKVDKNNMLVTLESYSAKHAQFRILPRYKVRTEGEADLEAYLVAEGLHEEKLTETVHLRLREVDPMIPSTMRPSTSGITYWQIEDEHTIIYGGPLYWGQQVRFRHMTTRHYLCLGSGSKWSLTSDAYNPRAVFRLHPLLKVSDEIHDDSYARIEHVLTGYWLHGERNEVYKRQSDTGIDINDLSTLPWDGAKLRQIGHSKDRMYHDAYTLQVVEVHNSANFIYVAGMAPFLLELINQVTMTSVSQ